MDNLKDVEEILSDDYEEGEILDEDDKLDEVSSLEEFSSGELEFDRINKNNVGSEFTEVRIVKERNEHSKHRRKKEHLCKEDSVCRKEREGKHCFARIKRDKPISSKSKVVDTVPQPENDKDICKKPEASSSAKRSTERIKPNSSAKLRQESNPKSSRNDFKDYHEKENRLSNKKSWNNDDRERSRGWKRYPQKRARSRSRTRDYGISRNSKLSRSKSPSFQSDIESRKKNKIVENQSKTSLLKRLVGSGNTGVKTLKDNENITTVTSSLENVESSKTNEPAIKQDSHEKNSPEVRPDTTTKSPVPEVPSKKLELKWIRSLKEDKDELQLRAEALRSAWVKKFSERKKKGLIHPKKSGAIDDSLADFVLDSDSDDSLKAQETVPSNSAGENNTDSNFRFSDLSGDVVKTEDMVIVSLDKTVEEPIICEPALQIVTPNDPSKNDSSVFILPSSLTLIPAVQNVTDNIQTEHSSCNFQVESISHQAKEFPVNDANYSSQVKASNIKPSKHTPKSSRDRRSVSRSVSKSDRKSLGKHRKKLRRKLKRESLKNTLNTSEADDEKILREQALLSLKLKSNRSTNCQDSGSSKINGDSEANTATITSSADNVPNSNFLKDKKIKLLHESEGTGATSSDNWEDDLDEDILRAQLLSSMTKQFSESSLKLNETTNVVANSNINVQAIPNVKPPGIKQIISRKQDKSRLRSINKKVWNSNTVITSERKNNFDDHRKGQQRFVKTGHKFIKNDAVKVPASSQSSLIPPPVPVPQVERFIISVDDSDSSSDDIGDPNEEDDNSAQDAAISNSVPIDIEASIDLLLQEAKKNSLLAEEAECTSNELESINEVKDSEKVDQQTKEVEKACNVSEKLAVESEAIPTTQDLEKQNLPSSDPSNISATPQALKHLPAWQQEEYRRLKKQIAERENVLQCTRAKVTESSKEQKPISPNPKTSTESTPKDAPDEMKPPALIPESNDVTSTVSESVSSTEETPNSTSNNKLKTSIDLDVAQQQKNNFLAKLSSNENNNAGQKNNPSIASCSVLEEISVMNDIMNGFERNHKEYSDLKKKLARLKRLLRNTESNLALKRKELLTEQDKLKEKDRAIATKIASISMGQAFTNEKNKLSNRMEFLVLRHKEASLRAQVLFHKVATEINDLDPVVKRKLKVEENRGKEIMPTSPSIGKRVIVRDIDLLGKKKETTEPPTKRSFSVKERIREEWDPNTPVCHFDLNGICKDEECKYQHFKTV